MEDVDYPHEPLPENEYTVTEMNISLRFVRKPDIPNRNFFEVFLGGKNIGYASLPEFDWHWYCRTSFPVDKMLTVDSFPEAQAFFFWRIFETGIGQ